MGVRATREAIALSKIPVVLYSLQDDANALQVRIAREGGGFGVGLEGELPRELRELHSDRGQGEGRVRAALRRRLAGRAVARGALSGYGPLAENAAAIRHFRQKNIVFVGPMQDVVESAGDKRKFRLMAQDFDPTAVTPGIVIDSDDPARSSGPSWRPTRLGASRSRAPEGRQRRRRPRAGRHPDGGAGASGHPEGPRRDQGVQLAAGRDAPAAS